MTRTAARAVAYTALATLLALSACEADPPTPQPTTTYEDGPWAAPNGAHGCIPGALCDEETNR